MPIAGIYQKILWFVAVHLISEPIKFDLIITIFEMIMSIYAQLSELMFS